MYENFTYMQIKEDEIEQPPPTITTTPSFEQPQNLHHEEKEEEKEEAVTNTATNKNEPEMKNPEYQIQRKVFL